MKNIHYTSAILGCGPRSVSHIKAYEGLNEIQLNAVCDKNVKRLRQCGKKFHVSNLYENLEEMLEKEKPDILHIVTPPSIREKPIELAARHGVKGIIVEKPIALNLRQARKIEQIAASTGIKIAVNMQRRYFKTCRELRKKIVEDKKIGKILFVRCVTKGNILSMGPHMIDLLLFFLNDMFPINVWACSYGMNGYEYGHPAPANMMIEYTFPGQLTACCIDSEDTVGTIGEDDFWQHLEFDFWGTNGRAWWVQNRDWGYHSKGMSGIYRKRSRWDESDIPGQREFTRALAYWLADDRKVHLNCLSNTMKGFQMIMGALQSSYVGKRIGLPAEVKDDIIEKLEKISK